MLLLVCYDVDTGSRAGRRRLRRVAKACESMGQRVQKSVFECRVDRMQMEALERRLLDEIDIREDSLRLYRLPESADRLVREHGPFKSTDYGEPMVL